MDINLRRIELAQYILNTTDEKLLDSISKLFKKSDNDAKSIISPMTIEELHQRIDISEEDFKNGRQIDSETLFSKYIR